MIKNTGFRTWAILAIVPILISGCSESKTVDYYYNHQLEARERVMDCQKEAAGTQVSDTCLNAIQAVRKWANTMNAN